MFKSVIWAIKLFALKLLGQIIASIKSSMLENIVIDEFIQSIRIKDSEGRRVQVTRSRKYSVRWFAPDFFPDERISVGPTGKISSIVVTKPKGIDYKIIDGGVGKNYCSFRVRAPCTKPNYLVRKKKYMELVIDWEAEGVYTKDDHPEPLTWALRLPTGSPLPHKVSVELFFPKEKPMLTEARVYKLNNLSRVERAYTDIQLDKAPEWERLPNPSKESSLKVSSKLDNAKWRLFPYKSNVAYMIQWDWWD